MKKQRWMKAVLKEAKKTEMEMPWARNVRVARRAENPRKLVAAE